MTEAKKDAPTPTNPPPGPQSTKPVAPSATVVKDPDESPKNPVPDNQAADKAKADAEKAKADAEFEAALKENDGNLTPEQQAELDKLHGDQGDGFGEEGPAAFGAAPDELKDVFDKFRKLHAAIPDTTPNSHTIWGAGGVVLTLGDIRVLIRHMR